MTIQNTVNPLETAVNLLETAQNQINAMTTAELGMTAKEKHTILQDLSKIRRLIKNRGRQTCGTCEHYDSDMSCDKWEGKHEEHNPT